MLGQLVVLPGLVDEVVRCTQFFADGLDTASRTVAAIIQESMEGAVGKAKKRRRGLHLRGCA